MIRRYDGSLFGLTPRHQILIDLPNVEKFMSQGHHALDALPHQLTLLTRVFGAPETPEFRQYFETTVKPLLTVVEREFINETASTAAMVRGGVQHKITSLVSFADSRREMQLWERTAKVRVLEKNLPGQPGAVEVDFHNLIRDFGASIAIPVLYGSDFLRRNPTVLEDLWRFDNDLFPMLMVGVPSWLPTRAIKDGMASRARLISALGGLYCRIDQYQKGEPVDFDADMSDVGVATERNKVYNKHNVPINQRGDLDFSFLWGQNANTQPLLFWFLIHIYSTPGLLDSLRKEITPWVRATETGPVEIESMDIPALSRECPLMKSALFETYRLGNEATSIRCVARPMTLVDGDYKHQLEPGTFVSAPLGLIQNSPTYFPEPTKFISDRFLEFDAESGKMMARYGKLRPWGLGPSACKGRTFAEKEILTIAAAVISVWEIEPAGGKWKIPATLPGTGAKRPAKDIRVIIRRRILP